MGYMLLMQTVVELPTFTKQSEDLLSADEKSEVIDILAADPECGDVIPGTGGIRKVRIALAGRGKRGGARVVYYFLDETIPVYALAIYAKNERVDLDPKQKKALAALAGAIKKAARNSK